MIIHHVAIYVGNGIQIDSPRPGKQSKSDQSGNPTQHTSVFSKQKGKWGNNKIVITPFALFLRLSDNIMCTKFLRRHSIMKKLVIALTLILTLSACSAEDTKNTLTESTPIAALTEGRGFVAANGVRLELPENIEPSKSLELVKTGDLRYSTSYELTWEDGEATYSFLASPDIDVETLESVTNLYPEIIKETNTMTIRGAYTSAMILDEETGSITPQEDTVETFQFLFLPKDATLPVVTIDKKANTKEKYFTKDAKNDGNIDFEESLQRLELIFDKKATMPEDAKYSIANVITTSQYRMNTSTPLMYETSLWEETPLLEDNPYTVMLTGIGDNDGAILRAYYGDHDYPEKDAVVKASLGGKDLEHGAWMAFIEDRDGLSHYAASYIAKVTTSDIDSYPSVAFDYYTSNKKTDQEAGDEIANFYHPELLN